MKYCISLFSGGCSLAKACMDGNHIQKISFEGLYPFEDPATKFLMGKLLDAEKLQEMRFKGRAVTDFVKHEKSFEEFMKKVRKFSKVCTLAKFVFDVKGCNIDDKLYFMQKFALEPINDHLKDRQIPEEKYEEFFESLGKTFLPFSFYGVTEEELFQYLRENISSKGIDSQPAAIQGLPLAATESDKTSQKPNKHAIESVPRAHQVSVTRRSAYNHGSAPPRRSNRIRGSQVDDTGLPQNYRR